MKKNLFLLFLYVITIRSYGFGGYTTVTLKVGESYSLSASNFNTSQTHLISGDAIMVSYNSSSPSNYKVYAVKPGTASFSYYDKCVLFNVVDVIPNKINLVVGEQLTLSPNIGSGVNLAWSSNNPSVATITSGGVVTGVAAGQATITCTNTDGTSFSCFVTISNLFANSVTLNSHSYQLNVNDNFLLEPMVLPSNTTNKQVKWISTNENIAQVDDEGNVTAIASGYCSIFCIVDDGSRKYDKCLIHVQDTAASRADVNGDGRVSVTDAFSVIDVILNNQ